MSVPSDRSVDTVRKVPEQGGASEERSQRFASPSPSGRVASDSPAGRLASPALSGTSPRTASIQLLAAPLPVGSRPSPSTEVSSIALDDASLASPTREAPGMGPGRSVIAAALASYGRSPPTHGTPATRDASPGAAPSERAPLLEPSLSAAGIPTSYGTPARQGSPRPIENHDVIRRMLVQPEDVGRSHRDSSIARQPVGRGSRAPSVAAGSMQLPDAGGAGPGFGPDEFSSLELQGGDVTRQIYRWAEGNDVRSIRNQRSRSFANIPRPAVEGIQNIKQPGGLRRNYMDMHRRPASPRSPGLSESIMDHDEPQLPARPHRTSNFLEFITLYGHFGGEELREEDEYDYEDTVIDEDDEEGRPLLSRRSTAADRRRNKTLSGQRGNASASNAVATLLKSFVGTGVLFLPRAFMNGGMLFSSLVLLFVAALSYYCFILLVNTQMQVGGSFGDMGEQLYGKTLRFLILSSLVLSQIGFVSAYLVFTAENLQAFVEAVSDCTAFIAVKWLIMIQVVVLLPLSLIRRIHKLAFTAYVADAFIILGLVYLYAQDIKTMIDIRGAADITLFNPDNWSLFIGTAIFTFEGIGLILPIQESMREPQKFPIVLGGVMVFITILFTSIGAFSYAAFGSKTNTVILLNMPQDSVLVNVVQFLYSVAILLSTPLQLFPAIRILEQAMFKPSLSGRSDLKVKWQKNFFRFALCIGCAFIAWGGADDLDKFVSLVGSFACIPLVYVYPPMLHYKAGAKSRRQRLIDIFLGVFGLGFMVYTTTLTALSWSKGSPASPGYCDEQKSLSL